MKPIRFLLVTSLMLGAAAAHADEHRLQPIDLFELEWASDPQISPDGASIAYVRNFMDIMSDSRRSNIWLISFDGKTHRPLTSGKRSASRLRSRLIMAGTCLLLLVLTSRKATCGSGSSGERERKKRGPPLPT